MPRLLLSLVVFAFLACLSPLAHAATYYLSPSGNDTANGSATSPWKTISKANGSATTGDTIIFKDGTYTGTGNAYTTITKANTTWKAENKHKAIVDGGFKPGDLNNNWNNIVSVWNSKCSNIGEYTPLLRVQNTHHVVIDGLFLRNSCGRGLGITATPKEANQPINRIDDITIQNTRIDWSLNSGLLAEPANQNRDHMVNFKFLNNDMTRVAIGDEYNVRVAGACQPKDTPEAQKIKKYCVNISAAIGGTNTLFKGNLIAWGEGEVSPQPGTKGLIFEDNILVGNKNSFYTGMVEDAIARNNLFFAPENKKPPAGGDEDEESTGSWRFGLRNEAGHVRSGGRVTNTNIAIYNNLIINTFFFITGSNNDHIGDNSQIYFGNNTLVAGPALDNIISISHAAKTGVGDPKLTGIIENNIFDTSKNRAAIVKIGLSDNDQLTIRNNIFPQGAPSVAQGNGNIITNNSGLANPSEALNLTYPNIGPETIDIEALKRNVIKTSNYYLTQSSPAINAGSTAGTASDTQVPQGVRTTDFLRANRVGNPDIGAIEYDGVLPPTPTPTEWDFNANGTVDIFDFNLFVKRVLSGSNSWSNLADFISAFRLGAQ